MQTDKYTFIKLFNSRENNAKLLVCEVMNRGSLSGKSWPEVTINEYKDEILKISNSIGKTVDKKLEKKKGIVNFNNT